MNEAIFLGAIVVIRKMINEGAVLHRIKWLGHKKWRDSDFNTTDLWKSNWDSIMRMAAGYLKLDYAWPPTGKFQRSRMVLGLEVVTMVYPVYTLVDTSEPLYISLLDFANLAAEAVLRSAHCFPDLIKPGKSELGMMAEMPKLVW